MEATCERRQGTRQPVRRASESGIPDFAESRASNLSMAELGLANVNSSESPTGSPSRGVSGASRFGQSPAGPAGDRVHLPVSSGCRLSRWARGRLRKPDRQREAGPPADASSTSDAAPRRADTTTGSGVLRPVVGCYDESHDPCRHPCPSSSVTLPMLSASMKKLQVDGGDLAPVSHLWTRPLPPPSISASTSATPTRWKSPEIECFRQPAAVAKSRALLSSAWVARP